MHLYSRRRRIVPRIIRPADEEEVRVVPGVVGLDDAGLAEAVAVKGGVVVDEQHLAAGAAGELGVDPGDRDLDLAVDGLHHGVHARAQLPPQLGPAPPDPQAHVVALGRLRVEELRVAGHGDEEPLPDV